MIAQLKYTCGEEATVFESRLYRVTASDYKETDFLNRPVLLYMLLDCVLQIGQEDQFLAMLYEKKIISEKLDVACTYEPDVFRTEIDKMVKAFKYSTKCAAWKSFYHCLMDRTKFNAGHYWNAVQFIIVQHADIDVLGYLNQLVDGPHCCIVSVYDNNRAIDITQVDHIVSSRKRSLDFYIISDAEQLAQMHPVD